MDRPLWNSIIDKSISYLSGLKNEDGVPLTQTKRKTFVCGLIINAKSTRILADDLFSQVINPYSYLLTYNTSQDHLELLNACIRGQNGNNDNPNVLQFKSALKKIVLRASVTASKYSNCLTFDADTSPPIFSLKWSKNRSPLSKERTEEDESEDQEFFSLIDEMDRI